MSSDSVSISTKKNSFKTDILFSSGHSENSDVILFILYILYLLYIYI